MKVVIIEDNKTLLMELKMLLREIDPKIEVVHTLTSVKDSISWLSKDNTVDLIFMDIKLSDGMCFEIFHEIELQTPIVFTTSLGEYSLKAFETNSVDYLLKPINIEKLTKSLEKFRSIKKVYTRKQVLDDLANSLKYLSLNSHDYKTRFLVYKGDSMFHIETNDIAVFQLIEGKVLIITGSGDQHILRMPLDAIDKELDPQQFYRANRQFIVSAKYVKKASNYFNYKLIVKMTVDLSDQIIVSREGASSFKQWLDGYYQ